VIGSLPLAYEISSSPLSSSSPVFPYLFWTDLYGVFSFSVGFGSSFMDLGSFCPGLYRIVGASSPYELPMLPLSPLPLLYFVPFPSSI